jgi:hypothetical protein
MLVGMHNVRGIPRRIEFARLSNKKALELTVELKDSPPHFRFGADSGLKAGMTQRRFRANSGSHPAARIRSEVVLLVGEPPYWPFASLVWVSVMSRPASIRRERVLSRWYLNIK